VVDGDDRNSTQQASEKYRNPFRRIFAPQQNCITPGDAADFKFASHPIRTFSNLPVGPAFRPVAAPLPHGNFATESRIIPDEI
jgi:hypothetical protein